MDPNSIKTMAAAAGAGGDNVYVEDVFSTDLWSGNATARNITNGIDLTGEGGMVWIKTRAGASGGGGHHILTDTERGTNVHLRANTTDDEESSTTHITAFNNDGYSLGTNADVNEDDGTFVGWTFRKQKGFFDVVKYEGNASGGMSPRAIAHNLGCKPGCIIFKNRDSTVYHHWPVYHKSLSDPSDVGLFLNQNWDEENQQFFGDTDPTSTHFYVGDNDYTNKDGDNIIAYLFADGDDSDAQIFGDDGDESIIKMGTLNRTSAGTSGDVEIECGWEPQWILVKSASDDDNWRLYDIMRGMGDCTGGTRRLYPNTSGAEDGHEECIVRSTGFTSISGPAHNMIYIAIRRGPMKTPEDATKVFAIDTGNASATIPAFDSGFPVDFALRHSTDASGNNSLAFSRLQGVGYLYTRLTNSEYTGTTTWDSMSGYDEGTGLTSTYIAHMFRRAPGFFDAVLYTGTGSARTLDHNLGVIPELVVVKNREGNYAWSVYVSHLSSPRTKKLHWTSNDAEDTVSAGTYWGNSDFTSTQISLGSYTETNQSTKDMVAFLFASCPGVSKIGTYSSTGSDVTVDCGFSAGPRFILVKSTSHSGGWYVLDTVRGIVSGNDYWLRLDDGGAQSDDDLIDLTSSGFTVHPNNFFNADTGKDYFYLAIA